MPLAQLYTNYINNIACNEDALTRIKFLDTSLKADEIMFCYFEGEKIIAALGLEQDSINPQIFHNKYVAVDPLYLRRGLGKNLIEQQFIYIKNKEGCLINSPYSQQGQMYIKKYIEKFARDYFVDLFESNALIEDITVSKQEKLLFTLLIAPPGGGKTTWIKNNFITNSDIYDDLSLNKTAMQDIENSISRGKNVVIGDINLCDYEILKKAWQKLLSIANKYNKNIEFNNILLVGQKEDYLSNIEARDDGRNVLASLNRFYPFMQTLKDNQFLGTMKYCGVYKLNVKNKLKNAK